MALFQKGFLKYLRNGMFSDIVVECNGKQYAAHRAILAYSSEYFKRLLLSEFRESSQGSVTLKFPDPQNVFPQLLEFMYTGRVLLTLDNVIPLFAVADHYLVEDLCRLCNNFLSSNIQRDTALTIVKNALGFHFDAVIDRCITVIAKNFCNIEGADYDFFPPHLFLELLMHPFLVVRNEYALYELVCHYISVHPEMNADMVEEMMGAIRFVWMTYEELGRVEANPLVPRALIIEACMERLKKFEATQPPTITRNSVGGLGIGAAGGALGLGLGAGGGVGVSRRNSVSAEMMGLYHSLSTTNVNNNINNNEDNPRFRPRPPQSHIFEFTSDFDTNGIIYYIATQGGKTPWQNPVLAGKVTILASSLDKGSPHDLVELKPQDMWSRDVPSSWITIDLGPKRAVVPTAYTLRHGMNFRSDALRTWDLQGSFNGENWVTILRHANDQALNAGGYATHTWKIPSATPPPSSFSATASSTSSPSSSTTSSSSSTNISTSPVSSTLNAHPTTHAHPITTAPPTTPPPPPTPYRAFRILQTGRNSNNRNFLVVCGFEIYGELFERE